MQYGGKIIIGLVIFVGLLLFPTVYDLGAGSAGYKQPKLQMPAPPNDKACVEATEFMRREHMQLLDDWRDWVVRDGERVYVNAKGKEFEMSLQNTCMDCHKDKEKFCDRCHDTAEVDPYCWDCHIAPEEEAKQ
jgi:hypothetical protein